MIRWGNVVKRNLLIMGGAVVFSVLGGFWGGVEYSSKDFQHNLYKQFQSQTIRESDKNIVFYISALDDTHSQNYKKLEKSILGMLLIELSVQANLREDGRNFEVTERVLQMLRESEYFKEALLLNKHDVISIGILLESVKQRSSQLKR